MHAIAPKIQLHGLAPTSSCSGDSTWFGPTYHHRAKCFQICPGAKRMHQVGSKKRLRPFRQKKCKGINIIMTKEVEQWPWRLGTWSYSVWPLSKVSTRCRIGGRIGNMLWEKQPYPNLPVYVVCPRDGEGCSQTLHRNYLLPINSNRAGWNGWTHDRSWKQHLSNSSVICG